MKNTKVLTLIGLILLMVLAACGGGEANTDTTPSEETTTETNVVESESAEVETAVELAEEVLVEEGGYSFQPPVGYEVNVNSVFAEMNLGDESETQINIVGMPFSEDMTLDLMYEGFTAEFANDDTVSLGEREAINVNGLEGYSITMAGEEEGLSVEGTLIAFGNDTQGVLVLAAAEESDWDDTVNAQVQAVVQSISLHEIDLAALMGEGIEEPAGETIDPAESEQESADTEAPEAEEETAAETESNEDETVEFDTVFPYLPDAINLMGEGGEADLSYQTPQSLEDVLAFYREELTNQDLTERDLLTVVDESVFSIVFDGHENGQAIVIQGVDLGETVNVSIRFEDT